MSTSRRPVKRRKGPKHRRAKNLQAATATDAVADDTANEQMSVDEFLSGGFLAVAAKSHPAAAVDTAVKSKQIKEEERQRPAQSRKSEAAEHREQLEALRTSDPEFYAYLQQTDAELLDFDMEQDGQEELPEDEQESESQADTAMPGTDTASTRPPASVPEDEATISGCGVLTSELIQRWCQDALQNKSLRATRFLMKAYRVACHHGEAEEDLDATLRIASAATFNHLLLFVLKEIHGIFCAILGFERGAEVTVKMLRKASRWRKLDPLIKSYLGNTLHLLLQVTNEAMLAFVLRRLRDSAAFLVTSERLQRRLLRAVLGVFGEGGAAPRLQALLLLRGLALQLPPPTPAAVLKGAYRTFVQNARFMSAGNAAHVAFMGSGLVELFGLDPAASYEHAFHALKQLAQLLRGALGAKTKEAHRQVYCWQTLNCLELWARLLGAHARTPELAALVHPCAQLVLGAARLRPSSRYFPLHLRLLRAGARLERAAGAFIPLAAPLLDMLEWRGLAKAVTGGRPGPSRSPEAAQLLRVSKAALATVAFQHDLVDQVMELLAEHMATWATNAAFPELAHCTSLRLRAFAKRTRVERFGAAARGLAAAITANAVYVGAVRDGAGFAPKDAVALAAFLAAPGDAERAPLVQYAAVLAEQARQRRMLRSADSVVARRGGGSGDHASGVSEIEGDEDDVGPPSAALLRPAKPAAASQQPSKKRVRPAEVDVQGYMSDNEDMLEPYQLSDEED